MDGEGSSIMSIWDLALSGLALSLAAEKASRRCVMVYVESVYRKRATRTQSQPNCLQYIKWLNAH